MEDTEKVLSDCDTAINLNNKYIKALDRRAKTLRKQAMKVTQTTLTDNHIPVLSRIFEIFEYFPTNILFVFIFELISVYE